MSARHTDNAQVRVLRLVETLCKNPVIGLANKDLAEALGYSRPNVSRDMDTLIAAGWAEQLADGKYTITTKALALFRFAEVYMEDVSRRSTELRGRVEAKARQLLD